MQNIEQKREQRRAHIRKKKRRKLILIVGAVLFVLLILIIALLISANAKKNAGSELPDGAPAQTYGPALPDETATVLPIPRYDYSLAVPESTAAEDSYFSQCLFVGDARLQGFDLFSVMQNADILAGGSVNISNAMQYEFAFHDGATTLQAQLAAKQYTGIYLVFGLNELGWQDSSVFASTYRSLIDEIQRLQPGAIIYLHLIVPITAEKSGQSDYLNNTRIAEYNTLIQSVALEKKVYFLDMTAVFCDESGNLRSNYTTNGMHFNESGILAWFGYLKTHIVSKETH